ncbi:ABC transporter substrate-binding protein [Propionibacteriaceae bacterium Y1685]
MINRRGFLAGAAGTVGLAGLAGATGCQRTPVSGGGDQGSLTWWDHSPNLQEANKAVWAEYEKAGGLKVEYQYHQTAKLGQALQLAKQSNQLPDVHTNVGLELPLPQLIKDGWFQPLELDEGTKAKLGKDSLIDGIHVFDGKPYSFAIQNPRQYHAANWFNHELIVKAGLDPAAPPKTFDEFREACRTIAKAVPDTYGVILNLGMGERIATQVNHLAVGAGFEGINGVEFATGEFAFNSEPYLQVMEFLLSLQTDKLLFPGSSQQDDQTARVRWATGTIGYFFDGPWCPGSTRKDAAPFFDKLDVGPMLVPDSSKEVVNYQGPMGGTFFISGQSDKAAEASKVLSLVAGDPYQVAIADGMAQPPRDMELVKQSAANEPYKRLVEWYADTCYLAPSAALKNPATAKVAEEAKPVKPNLAAIIQGMFSGDVPDVKKALTTMSDQLAKERDAAIKKVSAAGTKVSADDYAFPQWKPRQDFTTDLY